MAAKKKRAGTKRKRSPWIRHVMATYKKNKSAGYAAAMKRAKSTWRSKKKTS